jgi:hypothetical protein
VYCFNRFGPHKRGTTICALVVVAIGCDSPERVEYNKPLPVPQKKLVFPEVTQYGDTKPHVKEAFATPLLPEELMSISGVVHISGSTRPTNLMLKLTKPRNGKDVMFRNSRCDVVYTESNGTNVATYEFRIKAPRDEGEYTIWIGQREITVAVGSMQVRMPRA